MTRESLLNIINNPLSDEQQRADAQGMLDKLTNTGEFDPNAEMWAQLARSTADSECRAKWFSDFRDKYKNDPVALRSFTPERENLRAKRKIYDQFGGDVVAECYDEEIPKVLAEKGRGYYGTIAFYVERKGMTQEAAVVAAEEYMEQLHQNAIIDEGFRSGKYVRDCCKNSIMSLDGPRK